MAYAPAWGWLSLVTANHSVLICKNNAELTRTIQDYLMALPARYPALTIASVASLNGFTLEIEL